MDNTELEAICNQYNIEWCSHYGEPGYTDPPRGILFANWNNIPEPAKANSTLPGAHGSAQNRSNSTSSHQ